MPKKSENNKLKPYETKSITWNKGKQGKYKILSKINREAFEKAQVINNAQRIPHLLLTWGFICRATQTIKKFPVRKSSSIVEPTTTWKDPA